MNSDQKGKSRIVTVTPFRTDYYEHYNRFFHESGRLRLSMLWQRLGYSDIPAEKTRLLPWLGALPRLADMSMGVEYAEPLRFSLYPLFDRWAAYRIQPGDWVFSSYGYANQCFRKTKSMGGITFLDGGNSHPENFWKIVGEEHRKWPSPFPPIPERHYRRSLAMIEHVDYILAPSQFVANSFIERGFRPEQILPMFYPVDLSEFRPTNEDRPKDRPFTIVNTGGLSLRKGAPYLLAAFRKIREQIPNARLLLTRTINKPVDEIISRDFSDLPIEWTEYLPQHRLAEHLREADVFIIPSLEEGLVRTAIQAMACGLPTIVTLNTGANDYIKDDINGSIVPLCDSETIASKALMWWSRIQQGYKVPLDDLQERLSLKSLRRRIDEIFTQLEERHR